MYQVLWVAGPDDHRDYRDRQLYANHHGADLYIEFHFNAKQYDKPGMADNPASVIVADNSSQKTRSIAAHLANAVAEEWDFPSRGVDVVGRDRNGYWNVFYASGQSILTELLYVSDAEQAAIANSPEGMERLAQLHVDTIRKFYPVGALVAISIGHRYKASSPGDPGAPSAIKGIYEADLAERLAKRVAALLEADELDEEVTQPGGPPVTPPPAAAPPTIPEDAATVVRNLMEELLEPIVKGLGDIQRLLTKTLNTALENNQKIPELEKRVTTVEARSQANSGDIAEIRQHLGMDGE